jgi:hypothetical protein
MPRAAGKLLRVFLHLAAKDKGRVGKHPTSEQEYRLEFDGERLEPDETLAAAGIEDDDVVDVIWR